jgi:hypothetical protein
VKRALTAALLASTAACTTTRVQLYGGPLREAPAISLTTDSARVTEALIVFRNTMRSRGLSQQIDPPDCSDKDCGTRRCRADLTEPKDALCFTSGETTVKPPLDFLVHKVAVGLAQWEPLEPRRAEVHFFVFELNPAPGAALERLLYDELARAFGRDAVFEWPALTGPRGRLP